MKTSQAGSGIHLAATRKKPVKSLRRVLEGRMMDFVKDGLRDIPEPDSRGKCRQYYSAVADISAKTLDEETRDFLEVVKSRVGKPDLTLSADRLVGKIRILRRHLEICARTQEQAGYASFMARDGFDISGFASAMGLFTERESIPFEKLPQAKIRARERLLRLCQDKSVTAMEKMVRLIREHLPNTKEFPEEPYQIISLLGASRVKARELLKQRYPKTYYELEEKNKSKESKSAGVLFKRSPDIDSRLFVLSEMVYMGLWPDPSSGRLIRFNQSFSLGGIRGYVAADPQDIYSMGMEGFSCGREVMISDKAIIQHELQHVFDNLALTEEEVGKEREWEMRAYLAELAFSDKRLTLAASLLNGNDSQNGRAAHEVAWARLKKLIKEEDPISTEQIIAFAKRLLNQEYRKACGLSYDEILEPFNNVPKSSTD